MNCAFCPEASDAECSARVRSEPVIVFPGEIQLDDLYLSGVDSTPHRVLRIERGEFMRRAGEHDPIIILDLETPDGQRRAEVHHRELGVLVKRWQKCGKACCWKHYREVSDGVYRCQEHWMVGTEEPEDRSSHKRWKRRVRDGRDECL